MKQGKRKVRKLSIRLKISVPVSIVLLVLCAVMGINGYNRIRTGMTEMGIEEAKMAAAVANLAIDGDLIEKIRPGTEGDEYAQVLAVVRKMQQTCGIAFLYTLYSDDGKTLHYGVSSDDTLDASDLGEEFENSYSEFAGVFDGKEYVQDYIDKTEDGYLISAYLPIYNSAGEVVGILGSDYDAGYVVDRVTSAARSIIEIALICMVLSVIVLNLIINSTMKSLKLVDEKIYDLVHSEGDLTQKLDIRSGDELELIADNVNALLEHIRGIMLSIAQNSAELGKSAKTVVNSLDNAESDISEVKSTMEEISAAMEETNASLSQVQESVTFIDETVASIAKQAFDESTVADETTKKVQEIYNKAECDREDAAKQAKQMSEAVNEKIECSKAVEQIEALTKEIISIASRTNLLALNASIEAARAGEAGKGFAVVAGEIGSLAANSANTAAKIQGVSREVIDAVNDLATEAENMIRFMNDTAMSGYEKLLDNSEHYQNDVGHLSKTMQNFARASEELRQNVEGIREAINAINIAVQESTSGLLNVTEVAASLKDNMKNIDSEADANRQVADDLGAEVAKFKL